MKNHDFVLIKEIIIESPPTFYQIKKVKKSIEDGHDVFDKYYLTANLFFNNATSYHIISKIVQECKIFLKEKIGILPEIEKMRLEIEYHFNKHIDLDNKIFFWKKLFLDVLKTPTSTQISNKLKKGKEIITTNSIKDDSTQYIDEITESFTLGGHFLIFRIYGRLKSTQNELNLF